jgi:hypothetical protein
MMKKLKALITVSASCVLLWAGAAGAETTDGATSDGFSADSQLRLRVLTGGFTSTQVACDTLCTGGPLTGGLAGTLSYRLSTMESTSDPDVVKLTGVDTITTATGTLVIPDTTFWNLATGQFVDAGIVSSGTGAYAGVHGTLVIQGTFDPAAGHGTSNYVALLSFPS